LFNMKSGLSACAVIVAVVLSSIGIANEVPERRTLLSGGIVREYFVQAPAANGTPRAVVIALHGGTRPASDIFERSAWPAVAMRHGFILVAPQGMNKQWNDGRKQTASGTVSNADDVGFIVQLVAELVAKDRADRARIFVTGASNGGMMSLRLACDRADLVAGIAPTIAAMPEAMREACKPTRPLPVMMIAGTADRLMTYDGSAARRFSKRPQDPISSIPETFAFWRRINGCGLPAREEALSDLDPSDGSTITLMTGVNCKSARVSLYRVNGGGHREPSLSRENEGRGLIARMLGPQNHDIEAADAIWAFLSATR
jgi:polyhydroxybutyrate depolymerase